MFALLAAILFGFAVIFDLAAASVSNVTAGTLVAAGLFCLALHLAGYGTSWNWRPRVRYRRRRPMASSRRR